MVIRIIDQKYKCGCRRGLAEIVQPHILRDLNLIMEWDMCKFPLKKENEREEERDILDEDGNSTGETKTEVVFDLVEDREYLGEDPELKPGNCFLFEGQFIAVDAEDRLVLMLSQTGRGALDRLWEERIKPEVELIFNNYPINGVEWQGLTIEPDTENVWDQEIRIPYHTYRIFREHFVEGRTDLPLLPDGSMAVECKLDSDDFPFPISLLLGPWSVRYKSEEFDDDLADVAEEAAIQCLAWFIETYPRTVNPIDVEEEKERLRMENEGKALSGSLQGLVDSVQAQQASSQGKAQSSNNP